MEDHRGTLSVRAGPMWSGKSTWLNGKLTLFADTGFSVLKITHSKDERPMVTNSDNAGSTHNSSYNSLSDKISTIKCSNLAAIDVAKYTIIGIDEGQFFPDLKDSVQRWVEALNKHVFVVGLDGDSFRNKFGQILDLVPIADEFVKLTAYCKLCQVNVAGTVQYHGNILSASKAPFTKRLASVNSTAQELIGGADSFDAVCRYHHHY